MSAPKLQNSDTNGPIETDIAKIAHGAAKFRARHIMVAATTCSGAHYAINFNTKSMDRLSYPDGFWQRCFTESKTPLFSQPVFKTLDGAKATFLGVYFDFSSDPHRWMHDHMTYDTLVFTFDNVIYFNHSFEDDDVIGTSQDGHQLKGFEVPNGDHPFGQLRRIDPSGETTAFLQAEFQSSSISYQEFIIGIKGSKNWVMVHAGIPDVETTPHLSVQTIYNDYS